MWRRALLQERETVTNRKGESELALRAEFVDGDDAGDSWTQQLPIGPQDAAEFPTAKLRNVIAGTEQDAVVDDLVTLAHLHEPAILHNLECRFEEDQIYTMTGPILLAVNPFKPIPELYAQDLLSR